MSRVLDPGGMSHALYLQVQHILATASKKTLKQAANEIKQMILMHGVDVLVFCLYAAAFKDPSQQKAAVLQLVVQNFADKHKLPLVVLRTISAKVESGNASDASLASLLKLLKLTPDAELAVLVGLASAPDAAVRTETFALIKGRLDTLSVKDGSPPLPLASFHALLSLIESTTEVFSESEETAVVEALKRAHPTVASSLVMYPTLHKSRAAAIVLPSGVGSGAFRVGGAGGGGAARRLSSNLVTRLRATACVADLMEDLGYASAATSENFKVVLAQFPALKVQDIARIVGMMSRTHTGLEDSAMLHTFSRNSTWNARPGLKTWNVNVFVDTIKELYPKTNWPSVIQNLDHPEFELYDARGFGLILSVHRRATKAPFPVDAMFGVWANTSVQLSMLKLAVATPTDQFTFYAVPPASVLDSFPHSIRSIISTQIQHWFCVPLIQALLGLSEVENYSLVRLIFDHPLKNCPELLFLGLVATRKRNALHVELCDQLMAIFLANHANSAWILSRVWNRQVEDPQDQSHKSIVIRGMIQAFNRDQSVLPRLLDISQMTLKALTYVLQHSPYGFAVALAALAKHREFLSLVRWLPQRIQEGGNEFLLAAINFLRYKLATKSDPFFTSEILGIFLKAVTPHVEGADYAVREAYAHLQHYLTGDVKAAAPVQPKAGGGGAAAGAALATVATAVPVPSAVAVVSSPVAPSAAASVAGSPAVAATAATAASAAAAVSAASAASAGGAPDAAAAAAAGQREVFPAHIEKRANTLFQQIYTGQVTIDDAIRLLQSFKDSNKENNDVFACMLHSLFDEFRFFASYPDKELQITGVLFGKLIQHQLISHIPLGIAFRYVLEALRKPANSKMFKFGALALDQFKGRLHEWPQYCTFLAAITHLRQVHPKLMEWVDKASTADASATSEKGTVDFTGAGALPPPSAVVAPLSDPAIVSMATPPPSGPPSHAGALQTGPPAEITAGVMSGAPAGVILAGSANKAGGAAPPALNKDKGSASTFSSLPLDLLLSAALPIQEPPEKLKDRVHFIFNNVSLGNLPAKASELRDLLGEEHEAYLARYIVVKRAAIEPNFQQLYVAFMDALVSVQPGLLDSVLRETYHNVRVLIDSDDIASSSAQRTILKNLGSWLGKLTLGKNRPLLYRDLCPKKLILAAYESGKLIVVVPFIAKILAAAADSKVFRPPNAWTMAQLRVLIELYNLPDLKLILKFETEVLCNHLSVDQSEIRPTQLFVNRPVGPATSDASNGVSLSASATGIGAGGANSSAAPVAAGGGALVAANGGAGGTGAADKLVANLESFIRVPTTALLLQQMPQLQRFVPTAMDAAIREIIQPVVERSVTIACITTRELVSLDFSTEGDEERLRQAARLMARSLSGSLASVTCSEPVRVSMSNHLRTLLLAHVHKDQTAQVDQAVLVTVQENLELACALIEKAATERAVRETEEALQAAFVMRQNHAQTRRGVPFVDPDVVFPAIPPMLRSSSATGATAGLSAQEYRVYEDFSRLPMTSDRFRVLPDVNTDVLAASAGALTRVTDAGAYAGGGDAVAGALDATADPAVATAIVSASAPQQQQQHLSAVAPPSSVSPSLVMPPSQQPPKDAVALIEAFKGIVQELDKIFVSFGDGPINLLPQTEITNLVRQIPMLILQAGDNAPQYAVTFSQVLFTRLFENSSPIFQEIQLVCLKGIRDVASQQITKEITNWVTLLAEEHANNYKAILGLIRFQLIQVSVYDVHLAKMLVTGSPAKTQLAVYLVKNCCLEGRYAAAMAAEFSRTLAVLRSVQGIEAMLDQIARVQQQHQLDDLSVAHREEVISPQLREKITAFFSQWVHTLFESERKDPETCLAILRSIGRSNPELASIINAQNLAHLVHVCSSSVVQTAYQLSMGGAVTLSWYKYVDALTPLLVLLVRHAQPGEDQVMPRGESPAKLLIRRLTVVLNVLVKMVIRNHGERGAEFRQRVHFRILTSVLVMLNASMNVVGAEESDEIKALRLQTALVFGDALLLLAPTRLPGFAFAWLELVAHRALLPTLLLSPRRDVGWPHFYKLIVELLKFLQPFLRSVELADPVRILYKGTLRVLLVLLHDFPEFLSEYHFGFCDYIPNTCVQMRNLILSAFPRNIAQPDPFQADLVIDRLPAIQQAPTVRADYMAAINRAPAFSKALNSQLTGKSNAFLRDLRLALMLEPDDALAHGTRYNMPLINSLVLVCGLAAMQAQQQAAPQSSAPFPLSHPPSLEVFTHLMAEMDPEGRYAVLNAIVNQLRFPNKHTYYFSCLIHYLFASNKANEFVQEQIARVLLERLISNRPYPWGVIVTFSELIRSPLYAFSSAPFVHCAPEIERLFESVEAHIRSGAAGGAKGQAGTQQG